MTQDSREAFEAWYSEVPLLRSGDGYKFMSAHTAWNVWQACEQRILNELQSEYLIDKVAVAIACASDDLQDQAKAAITAITTKLGVSYGK